MNKSTKLLLVSGMVLFFLGLLTGVMVPYFENTRMGLSAHLAGVQNALALVVFGLLWKYLSLSASALKWCFWFSVYSMYSVWISLLLAAIWGTSSATPIAGAGYAGELYQESIVNVLLYSGAGATIAAAIMIIVGLIRYRTSD